MVDKENKSAMMVEWYYARKKCTYTGFDFHQKRSKDDLSEPIKFFKRTSRDEKIYCDTAEKLFLDLYQILMPIH